jgi:hypothetical protein
VAYLDHDETVLAEGRALHGEGGGRTRITSLKIKSLICHFVIMELNLQRMTTLLELELVKEQATIGWLLHNCKRNIDCLILI